MPRWITILSLPLLLAGCGERPGSNADPGTLSVSAGAEVRAVPDQARFTAAVTTEGTVAEDVLADNAARSERLLAALREAGVSTQRLRTVGVRLQPVWTPRPRTAAEDWRPRIAGYRARNQVEVITADLAGVGELLAVAVRAGADDIDGVHFSLEDDAAARAEAIGIATRRALTEAGQLADAAGVATGSIRQLRLDGAFPRPMQHRVTMDARMEMASVPVEPGEITISAHVSLEVAID